MLIPVLMLAAWNLLASPDSRGADVFRFNSGDGVDTVIENTEAGVDSLDVIRFGLGITKDGLVLTATGQGDLVISNPSSGDRISVAGQFGGNHQPSFYSATSVVPEPSDALLVQCPSEALDTTNSIGLKSGIGSAKGPLTTRWQMRWLNFLR